MKNIDYAALEYLNFYQELELTISMGNILQIKSNSQEHIGDNTSFYGCQKKTVKAQDCYMYIVAGCSNSSICFGMQFMEVTGKLFMRRKCKEIRNQTSTIYVMELTKYVYTNLQRLVYIDGQPLR